MQWGALGLLCPWTEVYYAATWASTDSGGCTGVSPGHLPGRRHYLVFRGVCTCLLQRLLGHRVSRGGCLGQFAQVLLCRLIYVEELLALRRHMFPRLNAVAVAALITIMFHTIFLSPCFASDNTGAAIIGVVFLELGIIPDNTGAAFIGGSGEREG